MGMAIIESPTPPNPRGKNTTVCPNCWAEYRKDEKWMLGFYANPRFDTNPPKFVAASTVPEGCCPVCLSKNQ